ncbi:MAG: hypothetical protein ACRDUV_08730 [Pseudonocardiaceae bacterium]
MRYELFGGPEGQAFWGWCHKCYGLFYAGGSTTVGTCPAGGAHSAEGSGNYSLVLDRPDFPGQHEWRWCHKCYGLFYAGDSTTMGTCPAGEAYTAEGSGAYTLLLVS